MGNGVSSGKPILQKKGLKGVLPKLLQLQCRGWLEFDSYQNRLNCQGSVKVGD